MTWVMYLNFISTSIITFYIYLVNYRYSVIDRYHIKRHTHEIMSNNCVKLKYYYVLKHLHFLPNQGLHYPAKATPMIYQ